MRSPPRGPAQQAACHGTIGQNRARSCLVRHSFRRSVRCWRARLNKACAGLGLRMPCLLFRTPTLGSCSRNRRSLQIERAAKGSARPAGRRRVGAGPAAARLRGVGSASDQRVRPPGRGGPADHDSARPDPGRGRPALRPRDRRTTGPTRGRSPSRTWSSGSACASGSSCAFEVDGLEYEFRDGASDRALGSDLKLGAKLGGFEQRGLIPQLGVLVGLSLPVGSDEATSDGFDPILDGLYQWELSDKAAVVVNTRFTAPTQGSDDSRRIFQFGPQISFDYQATRTDRRLRRVLRRHQDRRRGQRALRWTPASPGCSMDGGSSSTSPGAPVSTSLRPTGSWPRAPPCASTRRGRAERTARHQVGEVARPRSRGGARDGQPQLRSRRVAREVPAGAREAAPARRQRAVPAGRGRAGPLSRRPLRRRRLHPRADPRRDRRRDRGGRLQRAAGGCAAASGGRRAHPDPGDRRRLRRHLVLEPLPGRAVRHRVVHLPPLLEELGYIPKEKYSYGTRSTRTARPSAGTSTSTRARSSRPA